MASSALPADSRSATAPNCCSGEDAATGAANVKSPAANSACRARENTCIRKNRAPAEKRSEEHTSELQSLMSNSYDVFCLKKKKKKTNIKRTKSNLNTHSK